MQRIGQLATYLCNGRQGVGESIAELPQQNLVQHNLLQHGGGLIYPHSSYRWYGDIS